MKILAGFHPVSLLRFLNLSRLCCSNGTVLQTGLTFVSVVLSNQIERCEKMNAGCSKLWFSFTASWLPLSSHVQSCTCDSSSIFYFSSSHGAAFWQEALKSVKEVRHRVPRWADTLVERTWSQRFWVCVCVCVGGSICRLRCWEAECDNRCSPAAQGPAPQKPQADNECHTVVTTCTFMENGRRTSLAQTLAVYDEASSINQKIKERAVKHLWNLWREPRLFCGHGQKRLVSK